MNQTVYFGNNPVVLVVDDNEVFRSAIAELLEVMLECRTLEASDGAGALKILASDSVDLVLLDVNMPGIDGYEVCKRIRSNNATELIPVIFLTGQRDTEFIVKGFDSGGSDYLLKPFENRELLARVKVHLELKLQRDELNNRNSELEATISRMRRLEGIIPICMYCKKIRNDDSMWQRFEQYIGEHLDAQFTHGVCPECYNLEISKIVAEQDESDVAS